MKAIDLSPNTIEIVSPERFVKILADEPDNIAFAQVVPGRFGSPYLGGLILIKRKKPVYQHQFLDAYGRTRRTNFFTELGRIIARLA